MQQGEDIVKRAFGFASLAAVALLLSAAPASAQKEFEGVTLNINGFGTAFDDVLKETIAKPLKEKYGIEVVYQPGTAAAAVAKLLASKDKPPFDLLMVDSPNMPDLIAAGVIEEITPKDVPPVADVYPQLREFGNYGIPFVISSMPLYYNTEKIKNPPASLADLARSEYKGRVVNFNLENNGGLLTLIALAESNGGGVNNIKPGFDAYEKIKPNLLSTPPSTVTIYQLIEQGEAWVGSYWNGRILLAKNKGFPIEMVIPKEGLYSSQSYVNLIKNIPPKQKAAALKYLELALSNEAATLMAKNVFYAPTSKAIKLPPEVAAKVIPYGEAQVKQIKLADWNAVAKNRAAWMEQWNRQIAR
jgi:putative spermidine/putrescine transport system substrate-binding protein